LNYLLQCTICLSNAGIGPQTEFEMSKRLMSSAIVATLMMASVSVYAAVQKDSSETASIMTMMGG
ncbi:MAG: hypothetical protein ABJ082_09640, partial [Parasphingorhabdus sp.]|uniref:hypothetical protein n=1 Tax=Parasphingorhabdus sp. TaxID=2709688 RepID=UPI00329753B0